MKRKELKNLAKKIAALEKIIQATEDEEKKKKAEHEIMRLSNSISNYEEIFILDELIQEFLDL